MSAVTHIVVLRSDADSALAESVRSVLGGIPGGQKGPVRVDAVKWPGGNGSVPGGMGVQPDLAVLVPSVESADAPGLELTRVRRSWPDCPVLVVLPESVAPRALPWLEAGAAEYVLPPIRGQDLIPRAVRLLHRSRPEESVMAKVKQVAGPRHIVGQSAVLVAQLRKLPLIAGCDATVLISGETGTGKEMCARALHYLSRRAARPFVAVDCGAIPADLIENELFGHERGAFTTALTAQRGMIEEAAGGSLFLDEIHSLPIQMQVKLLRFLQEKEYRPLGSPKARRADVRIIAATNVALTEAIREGRFRQDLYYRLDVLSLTLPPLRERREDIPLLARHFLMTYAAEFGRAIGGFSEGALERLKAHSWPGNARELENLVQRAVLQSQSSVIQADDIALPDPVPAPTVKSFQARKAQVVEAFERDYLRTLLADHQGNVSAAARTAQKDRRALWELLRKHRLLPRQIGAHAGA